MMSDWEGICPCCGLEQQIRYFTQYGPHGQRPTPQTREGDMVLRCLGRKDGQEGCLQKFLYHPLNDVPAKTPLLDKTKERTKAEIEAMDAFLNSGLD